MTGAIHEVSVEHVFNARHRVRLPDGRLEQPNGHDWRVTAVLRGPRLDDDEFLVDFVVAEQTLREVLAPLRHSDLNDGAARLRTSAAGATAAEQLASVTHTASHTHVRRQVQR